MTTLIVNHRALARSLKITFEAIWAGADPFDEVVGTRRRRSLD